MDTSKGGIQSYPKILDCKGKQYSNLKIKSKMFVYEHYVST